MEFIIKQSEVEMSQRKLEGYLKLAEVVQWGRKYPTRFCEKFLGIEFLDNQKHVFMMSWITPFNVWCQSRGSGKALALNTKLPTPTGFVTMGDAKVGDYLLDADGKPTKVIYTSDIFVGNKCYEVEFADGEKIIADADHLWCVQTNNSRNALKNPPKKIDWKCHVYSNMDEYGYLVLSTNEIAKDYKINRKDAINEYRYKVPVANPIQYPTKKLPIHPYVLGVWLGNGSLASTRITCGNEDIEEMCFHISQCGHTTKIYQNKDRANSIGIDIGKKGQKNPLREKLRELSVFNNKHIPEIYLYGSVKQRFELLRGLMDTDGSCDKLGHCEFAQSNFTLIHQFSQLLSSLGIKHHVSDRETVLNGKTHKSYRVYFVTDKQSSCFKFKRKHDRLKDTYTRNKNKSIVSVIPVPSVPTRCIQVANERQLFLCGEKFTVTHNTTLLAPFIMSKSILIPNYQTYIISGIGSQAQETFLKIEKIAKKEIASFTGLTDVFFNETVKSSANRDGFTHNPASFKYQLYNGSATNSLNGNAEGIRSKRANCIAFDESGFIPAELFVSAMPFITQDSNFRLGGQVDMSLLPKEFPNQVIMASSASSTDTYFWERYKEYSKKMFLGDKRYFCADINAEIVLNPTYNGKPYPALLRKEVIDDALKDNKEKALREYFNKFSTEGGENQAVRRATIIRNSEVRLPLLYNDGGRKFAIAYDPARNYDNSVTMVGEIYLDDEVGYKMRICNGVSFIDLSKKNKTPMRTPEQVDYVKQMILDYNGKNSADYEHIEALLIDAGAGGGGHILADYFMEDWVDSQNREHKGLIDKTELSDYVSKFPNAVDKLKLMNPKKYKVEMYDALVEMLGLDLISFTDEYDMKGYLNIFKDSEVEYKDDKNNKKKEVQSNAVEYPLSFEEELALKNIDLSKEELVNIFRYENKNGGRSYDLSPDKKSKMHDDRSYCLAMLGWYLQQMRRRHITSRTVRNDIDMTKLFQFRQPQIRK